MSISPTIRVHLSSFAKTKSSAMGYMCERGIYNFQMVIGARSSWPSNPEALTSKLMSGAGDGS